MVRQGRHAIDASHVPTRYLLRSPFASRKLAPARSDAPGAAAGGATGGRGGGAGGARGLVELGGPPRVAQQGPERGLVVRRGPRGVVVPRLRPQRAGDVPRGCRGVDARPELRLGRARAHHQRLAALQLRVHGPAADQAILSVQCRAERESRGDVAARARRGRQRVALLVARRERGEGFAQSFEGFPCGGGCVVVVRGGGHRLSVAVLAGVLAAASAMALAQVLEGIQQFLCDASADTVLCYWHAEAGSRRFASHGRNA